MKRRLTTLLATLGLAATLAACGSGDEATAPPEPIPASADGATVYALRCASCHGEDLRGTAKGPSQLSIVYEPNHHNDDTYRNAIRNGVAQHHWAYGNMPIVEDITDQQIELVINYIRTQQQQLGFER